MDVFVIENISKKTKTLEELTEKSQADDVAFIAEDEKTPGELLTECIYKDFIKARLSHLVTPLDPSLSIPHIIQRRNTLEFPPLAVIVSWGILVLCFEGIMP